VIYVKLFPDTIIWALFCCCLNYEEPGAAADAIGSGVTMLQLKYFGPWVNKFTPEG
jgi:hypothetical protein